MNGQDVSNSSHEDAVRCFQSAQEPIIVEVLRRQPSSHQQQIVHTPSREHERSSHGKNEGTTNEKETSEDELGKENSCPLVSTAVQTDWAGLVEEEELLSVPLGTEEHTNDSFEDFLAHDIDFEVFLSILLFLFIYIYIIVYITLNYLILIIYIVNELSVK